MIPRLLAALAARRRGWEAICRRCGACCYRKAWRAGRWETDRGSPCRFLDTATRRCTVYGERFRACPDCRPMTLRHALFTAWLPADCGYVRAFRRPPRTRRSGGAAADDRGTRGRV